MFATSTSPKAKERATPTRLSWWAWVALGMLEVAIVAALLDVPKFLFSVFYARALVFWALTATMAFTLISWPKRHSIAQSARAAQQEHNQRRPILINVLLYGALLLATHAMLRTPEPQSAAVALYAALLAATAVSLLHIPMAIRAWAHAARTHSVDVTLALAIGLAVLIFAKLTQAGWDDLAAATLFVSQAILRVFAPDAAVDTAQYTITVNGFTAKINHYCSGYEGVGLVTTFLSVYLWTFRANLKFPNALLLIPIGIVTVWILNAVRIAALILLGAYVSPEMAENGFHSQAGWIAFLLTSIGLMVVAHTSNAFSVEGRVAPLRQDTIDRPGDATTAYLAPLVALLAGGIVMAAAAPHGEHFYILKVVLAVTVLWFYRQHYRSLDWSVSPVAVVAGVGVGIAWIVTSPAAPADGGSAAVFLAAQSTSFAVAWLIIRAIGTIIVVPLTEELAFRGFLYRWIVARDFENVSWTTFSWLALITSSLLFGLLHDRWLAAALAGVVFALLMVRTGRLSDAVAGHAIANALIIAWAIAARQWALI